MGRLIDLLWCSSSLLNCGHALLCLELGRLATNDALLREKGFAVVKAFGKAAGIWIISTGRSFYRSDLAIYIEQNLSVGDSLARLVKNLDCGTGMYTYTILCRPFYRTNSQSTKL